MKRTRKWLSLLLALVMLLSCLPVQALADGGGILSTASDTDTSTGTPENPARPDNPEKPDDYEEPANTTSGTCGENLTWELDENDTLTISGTCGDNTTWKMNIDGTLTISGSGEMDGWPLGETPWFDYSDSITTVVIEEGVTRVGVSAFCGCENLTHVIIPGSVTRIDYFSFACGDNLTAIMFEGDAPTITDGAFEWVTATAYYPANNVTWTADVMQDYGGTLTWTPYTDLVILEQPKDVPVVPSGTVDFTVAVHGDSLKYEWWVAAPGSDNFEKTEVTESTCTVTVDWDSVGLRVYCVITDGKGNTLQSEIAAVTQLPVMYEEETVDVVIDKAGEWVYYSFTPNYACKYLFDCYSNGGLSCSLYDSDMILLAEGVSDSYFMRFSQQLQTGKTYIFAVRFEDETVTGEASVTAWISHNYEYEVAIDATCTTDGVGKYTCIYCTDSYTETIPAAHNYVREVVTEPTCTADGQAKYTCSGCSDSYTEVIPASHQLGNDVCSVCGLQFCGENVVWSFDETTGTLTISGSGDMYSHYRYDIRPWYDWMEKITTVNIEDGVTSIAADAFNSCENLKTVKIGDTVEQIGERAFVACTVLETVVIPDSVTSIGEAAFGACTSLTGLSIGNGITYINDYSFGGCASLVSVHIPEGINAIHNNAFTDCYSLVELTGCAGLEHLFGYDFRYTSLQAIRIDDSNETYCSDENGWVYSKDMTTLVWTPADISGEVTIPEGVTTIGESAFDGCNQITGIIFPQSVTTIGESAFSGCSGLKTVIFPDGLMIIEEYAFSGCAGLTSVTLPDSITAIGYNAFCDCEELERVTAGSGVTEGLESAFMNCGSLTTFVVSEDNSVYYSDAYGVLFNKDKTQLYGMPEGFTGSYVIPDTVTAIYSGAFKNCTGLAEISIPQTVTLIGDSTFSGCTALTSVVVPEDVTAIGYDAFSRCTALSEVILPAGLKTIDYGAFSNCTALTGVIIPEGVKEIWDQAFIGCTALKQIIIPDSVTYLGDRAFCDCESLVSIVLPEGLRVIPNGLLAGTGLTEYRIPDGITSIGANAFADCKELKEICFSESVTMIGELAFAGCDSLETVVLPASITEINGYAFMDCANLRRIDFLGSVPQFSDGVFSDVTADAYYPAGDATWTPEMMEYLAGNLTWYSSDGKLALFRLSGSNVALGSSLAMNFFIDKDYLSGSDYYAVITHYDHDDLEDGCHVHTIPFIRWEGREDYMVVTLENLAAKNMIDYVEVQVFRGDGTPCTAVWGDSVQHYAMRIFNQQDAKTKTLLVDMLNYGAAAQTYFGYRDTYLVNECLTEEQQAYASQSVTCTDQRVQGENYFGSTLVLENRIQLTMYFRNITADMYAVVIYNDHDGNEQEFTINGNNFAQYNANIYGVTVDTLAVADGDQLVTVIVYDADGNAVASASDTVNGYLSRMMSGDVLFEAIAAFTHSAYEYFHQN